MDEMMQSQTRFDVVIIGAGAVGNAIARTLSSYCLSVAVVEKEADTAFGISGRNSGVVHAGFNNKPGSLMAQLCVAGSEQFQQIAEELGIPFKRTGKLVIALTEEDIPALLALLAQGEANGTRLLRLVGAEEIRAINPNIKGVMGLWSGMTGVFDPFAYTCALAEAAAASGVTYFFNHRVAGIAAENEAEEKNRNFKIQTLSHNGFSEDKDEIAGELSARWVINSGGLQSDEICRMAGIDDYTIYPCRGEYHILDQKLAPYLSLPVYPVPNENSGGLGVHLTSAPSGNIIIGPSSEYIDEKEDYADTRQVMEALFSEGRQLLPMIDAKSIIKSFAGVRPKLTSRDQGGFADFVIKESEKIPGFIILTGIESPGITSAVPIAEMVAGILSQKETLIKKESCDLIKETRLSSLDGKAHTIVCRCEGISEAGVLDAYDRILAIGAIPTMKGIKNRTRAGMGRCQGGFCLVKIVSLLQKKRGVDPLSSHFNTLQDSLFAGRCRE